MKNRQKFIEQNGPMIAFDFVCEGCQSEGRLEINEAEKLSPFGCPEDCGATYVLWKNPLNQTWDLNCVVCPIFDAEPTA